MDGEHAKEYTDDVLHSCTSGTYMMLFISFTQYISFKWSLFFSLPFDLNKVHPSLSLTSLIHSLLLNSASLLASLSKISSYPSGMILPMMSLCLFLSQRANISNSPFNCILWTENLFSWKRMPQCVTAYGNHSKSHHDKFFVPSTLGGLYSEILRVHIQNLC